MKTAKWMTFVWLLFVANAHALEPEPNAVFVRVVDVGAGLCCVVVLPDNHYLVYDASNYTDGGARAFDALTDLIPDDAPIDLLVLSHSDSDHLGAVDEMCDAYKVKMILHSGFPRDSDTWRASDKAIRMERDQEGATEINLKTVTFPLGKTYQFGGAAVTLVCGYSQPPAAWEPLSEAESRNAGSIVIRIQYKGKSILFCGDTVGRHIGDPPATCIAAEQVMVENVGHVPIDSDVIIAPHHGADNGSSTPFIHAVSPAYVIFSAGHKFDHPRATTAQRYLTAGVQKKNMFRTDRGDDEGSKEWNYLRKAGRVDRDGDDDVDILIRATGQLVVAYRSGH